MPASAATRFHARHPSAKILRAGSGQSDLPLAEKLAQSQACYERCPANMNAGLKTRNRCAQVAVNATCHWRKFYLKPNRATSALTPPASPQPPANMNAGREARNYCAQVAVHATCRWWKISSKSSVLQALLPPQPHPTPPHSPADMNARREMQNHRAQVAVNTTCHWGKYNFRSSVLRALLPPHPTPTHPTFTRTGCCVVEFVVKERET